MRSPSCALEHQDDKEAFDTGRDRGTILPIVSLLKYATFANAINKLACMSV
jgi:hypothetical protein